MRIAVVHPYPVHRRAVGGTTRVYEFVRHFAVRHEIVVFTHRDGSEAEDAELTRAGVSTHTFDRPRPSRATQLRWWFDDTPYYVRRNVNHALASAITEADRTRPFDLVHLELGYMAPAIEHVAPGAMRALAEQEVMTLVADRLRAVPWRRRSIYEHLFAGTTRKIDAFERQTLPAFDLLYGITPRERDRLRIASGRPVGLLPHVVRLSRFSPAAPAEQAAATVLFVGNFTHAPNVHAVRWFAAEIWPRIRALVPAATFEIVGAGLTPALEGGFTRPGVVVRGYVDDLAACYRRATVVVTPVQSGGGMRGTVLEAFASGHAVVATSTGLEGIAATPGRHCLVADEAAGFADAVVDYLGAPERRRAHGAAARALVAELYDAPVVFARLERDYESAVMARRGLAARSMA